MNWKQYGRKHTTKSWSSSYTSLRYLIPTSDRAEHWAQYDFVVTHGESQP